MLLILAVATVVGLGGLLLLITAIWPKRRGATPYCARCNYNLTGLLDDTPRPARTTLATLAPEPAAVGLRCPECGGRLAGRVKRGERRRRPLRIAAGACVLVIGMLLGAVALLTATQRLNWVGTLPNAALIWIADYADGRLGANVANEISTRRILSKFTPDELLRLGRASMRDILSGSTRGEISSLMEEILTEELGAGRISAEELDRFFDRAARVKLLARPRVVAGRKLPFAIEYDLPSLGLTVASVVEHIRLGSVRDPRPIRTISSGERIDSSIEPGETGRLTLSLTVATQLTTANSMLVWSRESKLEAEVEVLSVEPPDLVRSTHTPDLANALGVGVHVMAQREGDDWPGNKAVTLTTYFDAQQPIGQAYDVFVEIDGVDQRVGAVHASKGRKRGDQRKLTVPFPGAAPSWIKVILRPSADEAQNTFDLFEIFDGELRFEDLIVASPMSLVSPTPPSSVARRGGLGAGEDAPVSQTSMQNEECRTENHPPPTPP